MRIFEGFEVFNAFHQDEAGDEGDEYLGCEVEGAEGEGVGLVVADCVGGIKRADEIGGGAAANDEEGALVAGCVEKGAEAILFPVSARKLLIDLSDEMAAKLTIVFYTDGRDALLKALLD